MIAEDNTEHYNFLELSLKNISKEILRAKTGTEAVKLCKEHPDIHFLMLDIKLPKMDGYEVAREIRKFNKDLIIITQTAYALSGEREKCMKAGCDDYISKPIDISELMGKMKFLLK